MSFKHVIGNILPDNVANSLRRIKSSHILRKEYASQAKRFNRTFSREWSTGLLPVQPRVIFLTHQIEKGLGHREFRYGFGVHVFKALGPELAKLEAADSDYPNNPAYRECMSAVHEYIARHEAAGKDISQQRQYFGNKHWERARQATDEHGGSIVVTAAEKADNAQKSFIELAENRHSLREYSAQPVTEEEIVKAVELATRAPSACNRQPARVLLISDARQIAEVLKIQGGVRGYALPSQLLLVTAKTSVFMGPNERNQGFIDGGLFSMMLLMSLEAYGLAACPLHAMLDGKAEARMREILNVPDDEIFVMFVEVGHFPESVRTPQSTRLPMESIFKKAR